MTEPTPTLEQDVLSVAVWLYNEFSGVVMKSLWENDEDTQEYWLGRARELVASNTGIGTISVHFAALPYAEKVKEAIQKEFTDSDLAKIHSFSELHEHCDANVYLIEHGPEMHASPPPYDEASLALINAVTDIVDRWLREKGWRPQAVTKETWPQTDEEKAALSDWQDYVGNGDTLLGFRDWYDKIKEEEN